MARKRGHQKRVQTRARSALRKYKRYNKETVKKYQNLFTYFLDKASSSSETQIYNLTLSSLEDLGIDVSQRTLMVDDIEKLKNVSVLENFKDSNIIKAKNPNEYLEKIIGRIGSRNFKGISDSNARRTAEIFQTDIYHQLLEIGLITSTEVIELTNEDIFDFDMQQIENAMNSLLDQTLDNTENPEPYKQTLMDLLFDDYSME